MRPIFQAAPLGAIFALILMAAAPRAALAGSLEDEVLAELNFARTQPRKYAHELQRDAESARREIGYENEDPEAVDEAIAFLLRQEPLPPLRRDARLADAALTHAQRQGPRGGVGHGGGESLGQRLQSRDVWAGLSAENISYGYATPREVIRQLIVDAGVASRGHRKNIFGKAFQAAGVGCGPHRTYAAMCVIDFAGAFVTR